VKVVRRSSLFLLTIVSSIIGTTLAYLLFSSWIIIGAQDVRVRFTVVEGEHIGLNVASDELIFGKIPQGGNAERKVTFSSPVLQRCRCSSLTILHSTWQLRPQILL